MITSLRRALAIGALATVMVAGAPVAAAQTDPGTAAIQAKHTELGGGGPLYDWADLPGGGKIARFPKWGTTVAITWNPAFGAHWFSGGIANRWQSDFGVAVADQTATIGRPGAAAAFANGVSIYYSDAVGAHALWGEVRTKYWEMGHTAGPVGFPHIDVRRTQGGEYALFQGMVTILAADGERAHWISGALRDRHTEGGFVGRLGFPVIDQTPTPDNGYRVDFSQSRSIYWSAGTGARLVTDGILHKYLAMGGQSGIAGYPVAEAAVSTDWTNEWSAQNFQNTVRIMWSAGRGGHWISGALAQLHSDLGGVAKLGTPSSDQLPTAGQPGLYSLFGPDAAIVWGASTGAHLVSDAVLARLRADGDVADYGLPETGVLALAGREGWAFQQFQNASIFQAKETALTVGWIIRDVWWHLGGYTSVLGLPIENERYLADRVEQNFEGGVIACYHHEMGGCTINQTSGAKATVDLTTASVRR